MGARLAQTKDGDTAARQVAFAEFLKNAKKAEEIAVNEAKRKNCPGERGAVFGVRFYDSKKARRTDAIFGKYPVNVDAISKGKPGSGLIPFDYGYRQVDGSFIHADHAPPRMLVHISPTINAFLKDYEGFNTVVFCTKCSPCTR